MRPPHRNRGRYAPAPPSPFFYHLGHPETSIEEIALHTGYSEPGSFIRAFKNWTGFTPLQFRKGMEVDKG